MTLAADILGTLTGSIGLSDNQRRNLRIIGEELDKAGLGRWAVAFATNAYAESRLSETASAPYPEDSKGLFQLNAKGAGHGMSDADRFDPRKNTARIIEEARARGIAGQSPATEGDAVAWFAREVERCSECGHAGGDAQLQVRRDYADKLFGTGTSAKPFGSVGVA